MSILNENISIRIKDVLFMQWDVSCVEVAPRPYHALVFRLSGSASFKHDEFILNTKKGDVFYMPKGYSYNADYREKNEILVIHFESDLDSKMENYQLSNPNVVSLFFYRIYDIWKKKEMGYYYSALSVMCEILNCISARQNMFLSNETIKLFEKSVEVMEKNYLSCDLTVEKLVSVACMSNTYFRKLFISRFGMTPSKYIVLKRLQYAEKQLSTGKYSVKEVSEMSGFKDVKYFCRVVKKEYGVPPSKLYSHI